jgi:hypothetical protein
MAAALVGACALVGLWLVRHGTNLHLGSTYPLYGHYRLHLGWWLVPALALGAAAVRFGAALAARLTWRRLLLGAWLGAGLWAVALALVAGPAAIAGPLATPSEYLAEVDRVNAMGVREYLATFTEHIVEGPGRFGWTTHVAGHPPLATLVFALLARVGLAGPGWAAALCIAVGASAAVSVLATVRLLAGERLARRAAPFVIFAPVALWVATSADALFAGVAAAGICALAAAACAGNRSTRVGDRVPIDARDHASRAPAGDVVAPLCSASAEETPKGRGPDLIPLVFPPGKQSKGGRARPRWVTRRHLLAGAGGVALGTCLMLSYGLALLAPVAVAVVLAGAGWGRRAVTVIAIGATAALAVLAAFAAAGFWWPEGLARTADRVAAGAGWRDRPTAYFLFANPAALAVAVGPAVVAALPLLARLRPAAAQPRRLPRSDILWRFAAPALGALLAVALAIASDLSKGEVERIYLPFAVWLLPLAALAPRGAGRSARGWLAAQITWAILIAATTSLTW